MSFHAVIDTSAFIWDRKAFEEKATPFYELASQLMSFFEVFRTERPKIYLRNNLLYEMIAGFPYDLKTSIPDFFALSYAISNFLSHMGDEIIEFEEKNIEGIYSIPEIIREHYNETVKRESVYLISSMHSCAVLFVYFTFEAIWEQNVSLYTYNKELEKKYETIIHPTNNQLQLFFARYKPFFEHNPKHDRNRGWRLEDGKEVAPLSCFDGVDRTIPQKLLSTAFEHGNKLYNYDDKNGTVVRFVSSGGNKFHGFDERNEKVPLEIKKHFHIK